MGISVDQLKVKRNRSIQMTRRSSLRNLKNGGGTSTKEIEVVYPKFADPILLIKPEQVDDILKEINRIETHDVLLNKKGNQEIVMLSM